MGERDSEYQVYGWNQSAKENSLGPRTGTLTGQAFVSSSAASNDKIAENLAESNPSAKNSKFSSNPVSTDLKDAEQKASDLFQADVGYMDYINGRAGRTDKDTASYLRGMWDKTDSITRMRKATQLFRDGVQRRLLRSGVSKQCGDKRRNRVGCAKENSRLLPAFFFVL